MKRQTLLKSTLCLLMALACHVVWAQNFVTPVAGKQYKIKGTHATNPWLTATVESGGIDVAANEADAAVYLKTANGLQAIATGKYIGTKNNQISLVDNEESVTIEAADNDRVYIKTGGRYLYNNQPDYTREAGNLTAATADAPKWGFIEVPTEVPSVEYTINIQDALTTIKIGDETYSNGDTYTTEGSVAKGDITVVAPDGKFAAVSIDDVGKTINVYFATLPTQTPSATYVLPVLYPAQQTAVGTAVATTSGNVYTLSNNVLAASFAKMGGALYFAGSKAMDLMAGTEPFTVAFGAGDVVPASAMTLESVAFEELTGKDNAVGGAEHYDGHALVANYTYTYNESTINIVWRAVLRDGSHYLRTEMELTGVDDVDMFNIIPMIYNVDTKAAGSTPAVVGNTRGAVIMSNKIFAGLETPTAYNTVGDATGEEDNWNLTTTMDDVALAANSWVQLEDGDKALARLTEVTGAGYQNLLAYKQTGVELKEGQKVEVKVQYKTGNKRLNFGGADLLASNGDIAANDYHSGYSGTNSDKNTFSFIAPNDGTYTIRVIVENKSESIDATSTLTTKIYTPKEGVVINTDIVGIQGRWSRNTTLAKDETWKVAAVVGLIAQDGTQANADIHSTQKRRSFLAYSERERAVPWRAMSMYLAWYELQINRNNADPGREHLDNTKAEDVLDVMAHWKSDLYDRYGIAPEVFIIDDGWDEYGEWTFHDAFPNEMRDMSVKAKEMGAGIGAWLGPVGGYGASGGHRRAYWNGKGGMQLSNPLYYKAFKDAAYNLVKNQGDNYIFFKFDGISGQFSSVGPDAGDTGNENAEGIIRLEQYVREELREDIFFNTSVGTWASPFWYQITDATWRQENDHDRTGNNSTNRENWITYRDRLVYQNYVKNSPICPINTLMTHGFILTKFGPPASDERDYLPVRNELRAAFLCGSGMVEVYNDYDLMNSINGGALWADLAECIAWQKRNADVLPDAHWVGGNPWTGSEAQVYGWAAWNGTKSSLALRNGANDAQTFTFTLRSALNIPANVSGSIILRSAFGDQDALEGLTEGTAINIDTELTVTLPGSSIYAFEGIDATAEKTNVSSIALTAENEATEVTMGNTLVLRAAVNADATFPAIAWTSSDEEVATVVGGLVKPLKAGTVTITATAKDGSNKTASMTITVKARPVVPPFSTEEAPLWYSIEFKTGGHFLTDKGNGNKLVTAAAADSDEEYWMFIGYNESFKMKSRLGNYVYYNTENSRFCTTNDASKATELCFVAGKTEGTWELQRVGSTNCMNQNGGTGVGVELGEWNKGDGNNPFYLNEVEIIDHFIEPVFSDENNEHWFMIRFANGNAHLASNGANDQAVTANIRNVSSQWWKFVGTAENFQLVSKDGRYVTLKSGTALNGQTGDLLHMVSEPDSKGFSIVASTHASYPESYEIIWNGASGKSFNQWGGAGAGKSVGVYNVGNNNNPLYIYMPSPDLLSPFDIEGIASYTPASPLTLWYKNAASNMQVSDQWMEYSLPIGNGQFGASIFGGVAREEVQFNEKTLWSGTKNDYATSEYGDYENFGSVYIQDISEVFDEGKPVKDYYRQLDLSNATASVHYKSTDGNINFTREYIASYPDKVVAMHLTASEAAKVSIKVTMAAGRPGLRATTSYADGTATFGGKLETISYNALVKVVPTGGIMTTDAKGITVTGADEVLIILGGATDYDPKNADYVSGTANLPTLVADRVNAAAAKSWSTLYAAHVEDYKSFFDRCNFVLDGAANTMPTDDLIKQYAKRSTGMEDYALMLEQLYFAYGRYLEIGSSRGVDLPSNLQGIWNNSSEPAWNADIHANINVQMNYWPAEPTNLSELHLPFLNYIINMSESAEWKSIATEKAGQSRGWAFLTENNIFGGTGSFMKTAYINNAWYVSHLWQHYRYTLDEEFLERAFPAMWSAAMFWMDRLKLADDGTYVCPNEFSPEHGPTEDGVAHAQQLVWELFDNTLKAVEILQAEVNADDLTTLKDRFAKLDKGLTIEKYTPNGESGKWGEGAIAYDSDLLREWKYSNYYAGANGHRHMSHMMCLYPFNQLTAGTDLFNAAINSMKLRGDASTGWSMGWKINLWARALDGDHSHDILELALRHHSVSGGGVYYNLYDSHAPFQIDGNFGACAGIAEMLMQSHTEVIDILPALPSVWKKGSIKGLKAVGNFTVDIEWEGGQARKVVITNHKGQPCYVKCVGLSAAVVTVNGNEVELGEETTHGGLPCYQINSNEGDKIVIDLSNALQVDKSALEGLIADTKNLVNECNDYYATEVILQTTNEAGDFYVSTNAQEDKEGPIANLVDGNNDNHFHSEYETDKEGYHYININLGSSNATKSFKFKYATRKAETNFPKTIEISGSNDGDTFVLIATVTNLPVGNTSTNVFYESGIIESETAYTQLRFTVTANNSGKKENGGNPFFHMAEFDLMPRTAEPTNNYPNSVLVPTAVEAANIAITTAEEDVEKQLTVAEYTASLAALQAKYDELNAAMQSGTLPVLVSLDTDKPFVYKIGIKREANLSNPVLEYDYANTKMVAVKTYNADNKNHGWYFTKGTADNQVFIHPYLGGGDVLAAKSTGNASAAVWAAPKGTMTHQEWTIPVVAEVTYNIKAADGSNYFSNNGGVSNKMGFWSNDHTTDGGSLFTFERITIDGDIWNHCLDAYNTTFCEGKVYAEGNTLGYYQGVAAYSEAFAEAVETLANEEADTEDYKNAYLALRGAKEAIVFLVPQTGQFYRFKGKVSEKYMNATTDNAKMKLSDNANDAGSIFFLYEGSKLLSYKHGTFIKETHTIGAIGATNGNAISFNPSERNHAGYFTLKTNYGSPYIYDDKNDDEVDRSSGYAESNCEWIVEEVTSLPVTISSVGYATLYAPVALEIPEGIKVYTGELNDENNPTLLKLTRLTGVIPAGKGVLLYRDPDGVAASTETTTHGFHIVADPEMEVESCFAGGAATIASSAATNPYTLQPYDGEGNSPVAFKSYTGTNITGFKAYLELPVGSNASALRISFVDEGDLETGVESVADGQQPAVIYDLQGRRVLTPTKGMYIVNGKKIVIK